MASGSCSLHFVLPDVPPPPHHPQDTLQFPKKAFGKANVVGDHARLHCSRSGHTYTMMKPGTVVFVTRKGSNSMRVSNAEPSLVSQIILIL